MRALARRHGISASTVQKWRKRTSTADAPMGPKTIHSTVSTVEEEAIVVAFRRHPLRPLDDCLRALEEQVARDKAARTEAEGVAGRRQRIVDQGRDQSGDP